MYPWYSSDYCACASSLSRAFHLTVASPVISVSGNTEHVIALFTDRDLLCRAPEDVLSDLHAPPDCMEVPRFVAPAGNLCQVLPASTHRLVSYSTFQPHGARVCRLTAPVTRRQPPLEWKMCAVCRGRSSGLQKKWKHLHELTKSQLNQILCSRAHNHRA